MHPQSVSGDPHTIRWVTTTTLPGSGPLVDASGRLGNMLDEGWFTHAVAEDHSLWLTLESSRSWRECGPQIRTAITAAIGQADEWQTTTDHVAVLRRIIDDEMSGPTGEFIISHGGDIQLKTITDDGDVEFEVGGACAHCPLQGVTLHERVEAAVRSRYAQLGTVSWSSSARSTPAKTLLRFLPTRMSH